MIKVKSQIKIDTRKLKAISDAVATALEKTGGELQKEVVQAQVVPHMDGTLQGEAFFADNSSSKLGTVKLVHKTPYARRLYFHPEYDFHKTEWEDDKGNRHEGNPNAKGEWFEDWLPGGKSADFCKKVFTEFMRRSI